MLKPALTVASFCVLLVSASAQAQVPYPPPALISAQSIEAAAMAVGAARPEISGYLLLDVPEISLPGMVDVVVSSELPGTTQLVLLRQFPELVTTPPAAVKDRRKPSATAPEALPKRNRKGAPVAVVPPAQPTVLIVAAQIPPGQKAALSAQFNFQRNERFTLLAFAQGRWFATAREMKLAKPAQKNDP